MILMVRRPVSDTIQIKKGISRGRRLLERATLAFVLAGCLLVQFAFADGLITVTNADDAGPGTLRQAIADSVADDTIAIALNADDTIALTSGELLITNDLTIVSSNATIAIDAGGNSRVLEIGSSNSVILDSLIITNGNVPDSGGGILVNDGGTLTLTNCIVTGNFAGGGGGIYVSSNSSVALNNCIFSANSAEDGGAIANIGSVLIATRLSVSNNSARAGGGIFNANNNSILTLNDSIFAGNLATNFGGGLINTNGGTVTINNSTFSSNACPADNGGGIDNWSTITLNNCTISGSPSGGGFVNTGGAAVCNNSTFSGNVAIFDGGGYYASAGSNILNNCTISGNSALRRAGGLYENSTLSFLTNTIIAGNTSATTYPNFSGTFSGVNNLVDVDPLLAPLGNYGGPTQTMPPLGGSRCINAGVDSVTNLLTTDQRGVPRLAGSHVDIGAVEIQPAIVMNTNDDGPGSLRAIASLAPELIAFANALSGQTIRLTSGPLTLSNSVGIDASHLAGGILIDPGGASRVLEISSNTIVTLDSLVITNGNVSDTGGGILVDDGVNLTITNCTVAGNSAGDGGGIFIFSNSTVAINNSTFNGNSATNGGAIDSDTTSTLTLNNSTVAYNTAIQSGGGIAVPAGVTNTLNNCTVSGNSAGNGGGVFQDPDSVSVLDNTIVAGNTAPSAADIAGPFTGSNNLTNGNPLLAPLGNYGGPTQTMLPLAGSAAIDAGLDTAAPSLIIDQRGYPRQSGAHVDIGAVEAQWAPANDRPVVRLGRVPSGGAWQITFTNLPTADFTVLASTNVALPRNQWDVLGPATQNPPGIFQFTDSTATNSKARFYQVVSP